MRQGQVRVKQDKRMSSKNTPPVAPLGNEKRRDWCRRKPHYDIPSFIEPCL